MTFPQEHKKQLLAERLRKAQQHQPGPRSRSADAVVPLGPTQIGLWLEDGMDPGSTAYVVGFGLRVQGPVVLQRVREARRPAANPGRLPGVEDPLRHPACQLPGE